MGHAFEYPLSNPQIARLHAHFLGPRAADPETKTLRIPCFTNVYEQFRTDWDWEMVPVEGIEPSTY